LLDPYRFILHFPSHASCFYLLEITKLFCGHFAAKHKRGKSMHQRKMQSAKWLSAHLTHVDFEELVKLSDEELCQKTRLGCVASQDLLWRRHQDFVWRVVCKKNHQHHLPLHELADALQESYFAFHEAVQQYNPTICRNGKPASFKTFLGIVVARSFSNCCRQRRRYYKRFVQNLDDEASSSFIASTEEIPHFSLYATDEDSYSHSPAEWKKMLQNELSSDRLAEVLSRLKPKEINLLALWLQCDRDKEVAAALRISTAAAKLRRERLFRRIKQSLTGK
jgi:RNA polymerase sigma factor (sigma-70 family)